MSETDTINLFDVGILVNLRVSSWSGRKMVTAADMERMDLDTTKIPTELVNFGRKLMVPKREIQLLGQIEQKGRKTLERWSVPFGITSAHFVPKNMVGTVEAQLQALKEEYYERVSSFVSRFGEMQEEIKNTHPEFWDKCLKNHYPSSRQELRSKFRFEWFTFRISGISDIEKVNAQEVADQYEKDKEKNLELRSKMREEVGSFVSEYVSAMRHETVRFCELISARINGNIFEDEDKVKRLTPNSISHFRKYVNKFRNMNIFNDSDIEDMLAEFTSTFLDSSVKPSDFDSSRVKESVTSTLNKIREKAMEDTDKSGGFVGELKRRVIL